VIVRWWVFFSDVEVCLLLVELIGVVRVVKLSSKECLAINGT